MSKPFTSTWGFGTGKEDFGFRRGLSTSNGYTYAFSPDSIGRLSNASLSGNGLSGLSLVDYRYAGSRPVNRQHRLWSGASRFETTYSYDALRHLTQLETKYGTGSPSDPVIFTQTLVRDLVGKILEDQQPLLIALNAVGNKFSYDGFDRLQKAEHGVSTFGTNPTVAKTIDYSLDSAQNRTSVTETVGAGAPTTTAYAVAANANEYSSVGSVAYTYDGNGNLISDGFYYYVYDYLDRLSEVYVITYPAGATSSTSTRTPVYGYEIQKARAGKPTNLSVADAKRLLGIMRGRVQVELDRLKSQRATIKNTKDLKISSTVNDGLTSTVDDAVLEFVAWYGFDSFNRRVSKVSLYESAWYGYDGWRLLEEYDGAGNGSVSYFDGNGIDEHLGMASYDGISWNSYAFAQDQIGNVTRVTNGSGTVIARFEYDAYGQRTLVQGSPGFNIAYGFTGRYHDIETDLVYFRNRYYAPEIGRFITQDPIGIWGDSASIGNGAAFGGNEPQNFSDPMGLFVQGGGEIRRASLSRNYIENHGRGVGPFASGGGFGIFEVRVGGGAQGWPFERLVSTTPWKGRYFHSWEEAEAYRQLLDAGQDLSHVWSQSDRYFRNAYDGLSLALSAFPGPIGALSGVMDVIDAVANGRGALAIASGAATVVSGFFGFGWMGKLLSGAGKKLVRGVFIIGPYSHYPSYIKAAARAGADCFQVSKKVWKSLPNDEARWLLNKKYLDKAAQAGKSVVITVHPA